MPRDASSPRKSRALALVPFVFLAALFVWTSVFAAERLSAVRAETAQVGGDMLRSIEFVGRMERDVSLVKILADEHVLETRAANMAAIEGEMDQSWADYAAAAREYEPLADQPREDGVWRRLSTRIGTLKPSVDAAIALSRRNEDVEAHRALEALDGDFKNAFDDSRELVRINRTAADAAMSRVDGLQGGASTLFLVIAIGGGAVSLALGAVAMRTLSRLDALQARRTEALVESNRDLEAYAGRVAHDLKGPLTTASLTASTLARQAPEQSRAIESLRRATDRMQALIDDLLELARMQACAQAVVCDPAAVVALVREDLAEREARGDVAVLTDVAPATVRCREGLLRQAIWNLTDNAIKYRRPEVSAQVEVRGRAVDHRYELSVRDNGTGMSPEEAQRAFDPFYRATRKEGEAGTGLGLSIVKRVVEACGGAISLESRLGSGSTFVMRLPLG